MNNKTLTELIETLRNKTQNKMRGDRIENDDLMNVMNDMIPNFKEHKDYFMKVMQLNSVCNTIARTYAFYKCNIIQTENYLYDFIRTYEEQISEICKNIISHHVYEKKININVTLNSFTQKLKDDILSNNEIPIVLKCALAADESLFYHIVQAKTNFTPITNDNDFLKNARDSQMKCIQLYNLLTRYCESRNITMS